MTGDGSDAADLAVWERTRDGPDEFRFELTDGGPVARKRLPLEDLVAAGATRPEYVDVDGSLAVVGKDVGDSNYTLDDAPEMPNVRQPHWTVALYAGTAEIHEIRNFEATREDAMTTAVAWMQNHDDRARVVAAVLAHHKHNTSTATDLTERVGATAGSPCGRCDDGEYALEYHIGKNALYLGCPECLFVPPACAPDPAERGPPTSG